MRVGTIVTIERASAINKAGERGVVYEDYGSGVSIIFESGGYDGFSLDDLQVFGVKEVGVCSLLSGYNFTNVMRLSEDFSRGLFKPGFNYGKPGPRQCDEHAWQTDPASHGLIDVCTKCGEERA